MYRWRSCRRRSYRGRQRYITHHHHPAPRSQRKTRNLGEHFGLTEGSVWVRDGNKGYLVFSDNAANVIYKWSRDSPLSVFLEKSGYTGNDVKNVGDQTISGRLAILLIGSNGLTLDSQGRLLITAMTDRNVVRLEKDGSRTLLADRYEGKRFNGPNDIAFKSDGAIYFTDTCSECAAEPTAHRAKFRSAASI